MKAIVKATQEAGSLEVKEVPNPSAAPQSVLSNQSTGFCYTDISILSNKVQRTLNPFPSRSSLAMKVRES